MCIRDRTTAIKLAEGHDEYTLSRGSAQGVIDQFDTNGGLAALGLTAGTDFTFNYKDLIVALANATEGDASSVFDHLPSDKKGSMTNQFLSAAINLMERNGYILGQGDAAAVIGQFAATGDLSALGLVAATNFTFDVVDLSIA